MTTIEFPRNGEDFLNNAFYGLTDAVSGSLCSFLGPSLLKIIFARNCCPNGVLIREAFESIESFCFHLKYKWSSEIV